jgi:hypothetical protein
MRKFPVFTFRRWLTLFALIVLFVGYGPKLTSILPFCCGDRDKPAPTSAKPARNIDFGLSVSNGKITLRGIVPSEGERQSLRALAEAVFGPGQAVDQLRIASAAELPLWRENFDRALNWLKANPDFSLHQRGNVITLTGIALNQRIKSEKEAQVIAYFGGTSTINNLITLAIPTAPLPTNIPSTSRPN